MFTNSSIEAESTLDRTNLFSAIHNYKEKIGNANQKITFYLSAVIKCK